MNLHYAVGECIIQVNGSKAKLTHFMPLVSFYNPLNRSKNQKYLDAFMGYRKRLATSLKLFQRPNANERDPSSPFPDPIFLTPSGLELSTLPEKQFLT